MDKLVTILKNKKESEKAFISSFYEFDIGRQLKHPGIVQYLHFVRVGPGWNNNENDEFHILIEYMSGQSLLHLLEKQHTLFSDNLQFIKSILKQILEALVFLHD